MDLNTLWFILITVLFTGFFILEGFDYGVGMTLPFLDTEEDRLMAIRSIAPVWDGNEVWMITAGGALFAAFPHAYATMFSAFYLALFLMLFALILRGAGLELRGKDNNRLWRHGFDWAIAIGSALPALLWGVAVTNLLAGIAIDDHMIYQGTFWDLLRPYTLFGGLTFLLVFLFHGIAFLRLRIADERMTSSLLDGQRIIGILATFVFVICGVLTLHDTDMTSSVPAVIALVLAAITFLLSCLFSAVHACGKSFVMSTVAIALTTVAFFLALFPRIMVSTLGADLSLTIYNASSTPYTLQIMTIAAGILVPIVLCYQAWSYYIFRKRVTREDIA